MTRTDSAILAPPIGLVAFLALQLACAAATGDGCYVPYVAEVIEYLRAHAHLGATLERPR